MKKASLLGIKLARSCVSICVSIRAPIKVRNLLTRKWCSILYATDAYATVDIGGRIMTGIDLELFQAYSSVGESVDRIACFQSTRKAFLNQVSMQVRHENSEDDLIWRLMQLRKAKKLKANNLGNN